MLSNFCLFVLWQYVLYSNNTHCGYSQQDKSSHPLVHYKQTRRKNSRQAKPMAQTIHKQVHSHTTFHQFTTKVKTTLDTRRPPWGGGRRADRPLVTCEQSIKGYRGIFPTHQSSWVKGTVASTSTKSSVPGKCSAALWFCVPNCHTVSMTKLAEKNA